MQMSTINEETVDILASHERFTVNKNNETTVTETANDDIDITANGVSVNSGNNVDKCNGHLPTHEKRLIADTRTNNENEKTVTNENCQNCRKLQPVIGKKETSIFITFLFQFICNTVVHFSFPTEQILEVVQDIKNRMAGKCAFH